MFSPDLETHLKHLTKVLSRLKKAYLYNKLEKYEFCVLYLDFLGYRISSNGILMDPKRISSIKSTFLLVNMLFIYFFFLFIYYLLIIIY